MGQGKALENKLCSELAKIMRQTMGRGPSSIEITVHRDFILCKMGGYFFPQEKELAKSEHGFYDVKFLRIKLIHTGREQLIKVVSSMVGKKVSHFFSDADPENDVAILVFILGD